MLIDCIKTLEPLMDEDPGEKFIASRENAIASYIKIAGMILLIIILLFIMNY